MRKKLDGLRIKALENPWIVALLFAPFFKPVGLCWLSGTVNAFCMWWKIAAAAAIAVLFLSRFRVSLVTILLGVYQVLLLVSTLLYGSSLADWLYESVGLAAFCALMEMCIGTDIKTLVKGLFYLLGTLCLINLGTVLLFPGGMLTERILMDSPELADSYFMGLDNTQALFILPLLGLTAIYACYKRWPLWAQMLLLAVFSASICITWSATAVVAVTAFWAVFLLSRVRRSYWVCNIGVYYAVIAVMFLLLIVFRIPERFSFIIEDLLHKSITLSGRMGVWARLLERIGERPWLGYGKVFNQTAQPLIGANHCHNVFLQAAFETGIVGLAVYLAMLAALVRPLWRTRKSLSGYMLAATLFALLVDFLAESPVYPMGYTAILLLCCHAEEVVPALEPEQN